MRLQCYLISNLLSQRTFLPLFVCVISSVAQVLGIRPPQRKINFLHTQRSLVSESWRALNIQHWRMKKKKNSSAKKMRMRAPKAFFHILSINTLQPPTSWPSTIVCSDIARPFLLLSLNNFSTSTRENSRKSVRFFYLCALDGKWNVYDDDAFGCDVIIVVVQIRLDCVDLGRGRWFGYHGFYCESVVCAVWWLSGRRRQRSQRENWIDKVRKFS